MKRRQRISDKKETNKKTPKKYRKIEMVLDTSTSKDFTCVKPILLNTCKKKVDEIEEFSEDETVESNSLEEEDDELVVTPELLLFSSDKKWQKNNKQTNFTNLIECYAYIHKFK